MYCEKSRQWYCIFKLLQKDTWYLKMASRDKSQHFVECDLCQQPVRFSADDAGSISVIRVFQFIYAWDLSIIMTLQFSLSRMMTKHDFVTLISLTIVLHTVKHAKFPYAAFVYQPNTNHTRYTNCPIKLKNF